VVSGAPKVVGPALLAAIAFATSSLTATATADSTASAKRELTPLDSLATVRVMQDQLLPGQPVGEFASPDGKRYLIRTAYGDAKRNGVWMDLFAGSLTSLDAAAHPTRCAHLFTTGLGSQLKSRGAETDPTPGNTVHWIDATHIALLWSDARDVRQILTVNLNTCKHQFMTQGADDVFSFVSAPDDTLLYNAHVREDRKVSEQLWAHGFTVAGSSDGLSILQGHYEDGSAVDAKHINRWFIRSGNQMQSLALNGQFNDTTTPFARELSLAPNAHYAVTTIGIAGSPLGWGQYTNAVLQSALTSTDKTRLPVRYIIIDMDSHQSHMLWNAPLSLRGRAQWAPNGDTLVIAPTYLPIEVKSDAGLSGNAAAEVDARTGAYRVLPLDLTNRTLGKLEWVSSSEILITSTDNNGTDSRTQFFSRQIDGWHLDPRSDVIPLPDLRAQSAGIRLETRQSLNLPPRIYAVDRTGASRLVLDPNPHLVDRFKLGHVERLSGTLPTGQQWIGQLIYPADYQPGTRYPLVIQSTYGVPFGAEEFSLDGLWGNAGMGLGPSETPAYPGQLLATRNIAVLTLEVLHVKQDTRQAQDFQLAYEALKDQFVASGLADEKKIALDGFSQNGYWVEYTLAHTSFPFAAAISGDNIDPSYVQSSLGNWRKMDEQLNGAPAFGAGMQQWLKTAPGFNVENFNSPLLMILQSTGPAMIIAKWEIYSRLHYLQKPVQMYLMPRSDQHPAHTPQNPQQLVAVQDIVIDWLDYWLTGHEDSSPSKRSQYARWEHLKISPPTASTSKSSSSAVANP
jgi:hypothetical protein